MLTDRELSALGEGLYEAVLQTPLPFGTIQGLGAAIAHNLRWAELPQHLRFAVFKIVAVCLQETEAGAVTTDGRDGGLSPTAAPPESRDEGERAERVVDDRAVTPTEGERQASPPAAKALEVAPAGADAGAITPASA